MEYSELNKFYDLLKYQLISDNTFIDFLERLNSLINNLKNEIKRNKQNFINDEFEFYANNEIKTLQTAFEDNTPKINSKTINKYFSINANQYYRIDDILKMDKKSKLYSDLSFPHDKAPCVEFIDEYYTLQNDFLLFTKEYFITDIIDYFKRILKDEVEQKPFPLFFESFDDFEKFLKYSENHIIDPFIDYSYLIQRMKKEKRIKYLIHREIMIWLKDNDFIKEQELDKMLKKGSFTALSKFSPGSHRENNYNIIFN